MSESEDSLAKEVAELRGRTITHGGASARIVAIRNMKERKEVEREQGRRLMLAHVHRGILEMEQGEDFAKVVELFARELRQLGIQFDATGLNLVDEKADALFSYTVYFGEEARHSINPIGDPTNQGVP